MLRSTGRTEQFKVAAFNVKHPILFGSQQPLERLYLQCLHKHCHQGVEYLRALIQQSIAILKLQLHCVQSKAVTVNPLMADLPKKRLVFD